ncbi:hypothetical protein HYH02_011754 [Chlamydomonas schloesseri]|uniref:Heat shock protein 101 n=1 Tax=Chlamydomonas schloesseri TaxID=2026947 RepID=A0A835SZH8_9CHLO|nr:hypothetical protein HYH02_011754 [Chlamydomonas schloesseri]|eukprot:KAG2436043.1 hypothetical protein HYH02_011754 [Chlamydomonas schloesseri]
MGGTESKPKKIEDFSVDLTAVAGANKLMPVIGRDEETARVIKTLCRRNKNNPCLVGDPGVGKTAIVEGLAQRIVASEVPDMLKGAKIMSLNMGDVVAGASSRGDFEERLKNIIKEAKESEGKTILFIDEMHMLLAAGAGSGGMTAANILKPELARGEIKVIGATTLDEYRTYVEKDPALERRFQKILVNEPSVKDTVNILRGLKAKYEAYHGLSIADKAIQLAAELSARYIQGRYLPDKAIDLIDEACSNVRVMQDSKNEEMALLEQKKIRLEVEAAALGKERDRASKERLKEVMRELQEVLDKYKPLEGEFEREKQRRKDLAELERQRGELAKSVKAARATNNQSAVYAYSYGAMHDLSERIEDLKEQGQDTRLISQEVGPEEIAGVVSRWTGVPITRLTTEERERLLNLKQELHRRLVGQDEAVSLVADAVMKSRAGFAQEDRPSSFMFLGPTGCGKTELAKALAETMFGEEKYMVRLDMGEYTDRNSVYRLIGAPPGFPGHDEGGQLTEAVRRQPYTVVLFDECEKADEAVFNTLLSLLDDGRMTDGKGRTVSFVNTIIVFTSNIGAQLVLDFHKNEKGAALAKQKVVEEVKKKFKPEFVNRIDALIVFEPLQQKHILSIARLLEKSINQRLLSRGLRIKMTDAALEYVVSRAYEPEYGARPLRRWLELNMVTELSRRVLAKMLPEQGTIRVDHSKNADGGKEGLVYQALLDEEEL